MIRSFRLWLWVAVVALGLTAGAAALLLRQPAQAARSFGGGTYSLVDQNGKAVDQTMFQGHPSMLFFGYTHCPDVCPTTMAEMASWFQELGNDGKDLRAYFVTVDPERDTTSVLGDYVSWVSDRITAVTGDPAEIAKIIKAWGIFAEKVPLGGDEYSMDHTASVFLLNTKGEFEGTIAYGEANATALGKLRNLLAKS
ncbi:SCO family protein [Devosia sp.]|uniref:SCO family protein n=1 Tax=Devosia sp. TaxID=1871048 RepID=UPI002622007E|nr:SCO family protein [Devosia sp.]